MESNPPEDAKILERLQDYTDAAGDAERMQKISMGFEQSIGSISEWLTRFGLANESGQCEVPLDMEIIMDVEEGTISDVAKSEGGATAEAGSIVEGNESAAAAGASTKKATSWRRKTDVLNAVTANVDRILEYRQRQFSAMRAKVA